MGTVNNNFEQKNGNNPVPRLLCITILEKKDSRVIVRPSFPNVNEIQNFIEGIGSSIDTIKEFETLEKTDAINALHSWNIIPTEKQIDLSNLNMYPIDFLSKLDEAKRNLIYRKVIEEGARISDAVKSVMTEEEERSIDFGNWINTLDHFEQIANDEIKNQNVVKYLINKGFRNSERIRIFDELLMVSKIKAIKKANIVTIRPEQLINLAKTINIFDTIESPTEALEYLSKVRSKIQKLVLPHKKKLTFDTIFYQTIRILINQSEDVNYKNFIEKQVYSFLRGYYNLMIASIEKTKNGIMIIPDYSKYSSKSDNQDISQEEIERFYHLKSFKISLVQLFNILREIEVEIEK